MPHHFTLDQAQALVRELEPDLRHAVSLKAEFVEAESALQSELRRLTMAGGVLVDREDLLARRRRRDEFAVELNDTLERIHDSGCQVKDLDMGLLDFPTLLHGREVLLCWRLGEPSIAFWHGLEEGFSGRKPIDDDFRRDHRGDRPH